MKVGRVALFAIVAARLAVAVGIGIGIGIGEAPGCSAPDYRFAPKDAGGPSPDGTSTGGGDTGLLPDLDSGDSADAPEEPPPPAVALPAFGLAAGDFAAACNGAATAASSAGAFDGGNAIGSMTFAPDGGGKRTCVLYFASLPYQRTWQEALAACQQVSLSTGEHFHLATFSSGDLATAVRVRFPKQTPWIGLALKSGADPLVRASYAWVDGTPYVYDGWVDGTPAGQSCVTWVNGPDPNLAQWYDQSCYTDKGFFCSLAEP